MTLNIKSIITGLVLAIFLEVVFYCHFWSLIIGTIAATKMDKTIDPIKGMIYGAIIGLIFGLFATWHYEDYGTSLFGFIAGLVIVSLIAGSVGALTGMIIRSKEHIIF